MKSWHTYILKCKDGTFYTGVTTDIPHRLKTPSEGKGAKYTRSRLPVVLVWSEQEESESLAKKREAEIKKWPRAKKILLITSL